MLTLAYIVLALVGCGYILLATFLGHLGDQGGHADSGHADSGHADGHATEHYGVDGSGHGEASAGAHGSGAFHFPFFSPLALATLCASIGAYGLITRYGFKASEGTSLAVAVPAAILTAYGITYAAWHIVRGSQGSSAIRLADVAGAQGEILTPIPAAGVGEVVALVAGQRFTGPARTEHGEPIPRGTTVTVVRMVGTTLIVRASQGDGPNG